MQMSNEYADEGDVPGPGRRRMQMYANEPMAPGWVGRMQMRRIHMSDRLGARMQMSCGSAGSARGDAGGRSQDGPRPTREETVNINELMQMHANEARTGGGAGPGQP